MREVIFWVRWLFIDVMWFWLKINFFKDTDSRKEWLNMAKFLLGFVIFSTLFFKPYNIPSGSMTPNLLIGDFVVVNKYCFGYTRYSLPFGCYIPWFKGRILGSNSPKMGEIAVFNNPKDEDKAYVKRVIATAGDVVQMRTGRLWINDKICPIKRIADFGYQSDNGETVMVPQYAETLPNGVVHTFIKIYFPFGKAPPFEHDVRSSSDDTPAYTIPANHFMVIGDNRDGSMDSRFMSNRIGFINVNELMGKVEFIFFSTGARWYQPLKWFTEMRFERFFTRPH